MKKGVIVTGGGKGIGKQICLDFLAKSYQVCFIDVDKEAGSAFGNTSENLYFFHGDIKDKKVLDNFVLFALKKMSRIDILINNACINKGGILNNASYEDFDEVLAVGLKAPYALALLCKQGLIKNKGKIINIASSRAFQSEPNSEAYASAKGGIVALTHSLAISLAPDVLVNCIAPGWIHVDEKELISKIDQKSIPAGKVGSPKDISEMVMYLCNQTFITGETFTIDGGMSKRMIYHNEWNWKFKDDEDSL